MFVAISIGLARADIPGTHNNKKILLPTTVPIAMSASFFLAAMTPAVRSGNDVPTAIIVIPITTSLTPSDLAISLPENTINFAPMLKPISPRSIDT